MGRHRSETASVELKPDEDCLAVTLHDGKDDGSFIADLLVKNSFRVRMLKEEEIDLEDVFMGITKDHELRESHGDANDGPGAGHGEDREPGRPL